MGFWTLGQSQRIWFILYVGNPVVYAHVDYEL
jgi:hypothetical protein